MNLRRNLLFITLIFMLMFLQNNLTSQEDKENEEEEFVEEGVQIENPNTKEYIAKAINFLDRANRTSDKDSALNDRIEGLTRLQEILTQQKYRDDVVYNQTEKIYQGARVYVRKILENRSDEILDLYKSRYEKIAESRIQNAIFNKNIDILKDVIRTYPYTDSALNGAVQASRILIEQNRLPEATSIMSKLLYQYNIDIAGKTSLVAQLAFCFEKLLWDYELEKLLAYLRKNLPEARFKLGHNFVDLPSYVESKLTETRKRIKSPNYSEIYNKDGGNASNNKIVQAITDPDEFRWSETHPQATVGPKEPYNGLNYIYYEGNLKRIFPSVSDATVYVPYRNNLTAYNLYSGVKKWAFSNRIENGYSWIPRIDSAVIYTVSCDNNNVYAPIESYVPNYLLESSTYRLPYTGPAIITPTKRELICFDKHNGDIKWRVGAKWDDSLPLHEILSYPIAPTIVDATAYVIGCTLTANAHFFLLAFDINGEFQDGKRTGNAKLNWIAKIATGQQEINMFGSPIREPIPQGLAYMDNKIIACTNVDLISAFDADTGERIWAQPYEKIPYISTKSYTPNFRRLTWFNRPPIIYKGKVVVTPLDSSKVYCYDIESGKLLWNYRYNPYDSSSRYLIGVYNDKVLFGGSKYLFTVDIESGKLTNALDLYEESRINDYKASGKPVIMGNLCLIPTRTSILHVDLNIMKVVKVSGNNDYSASIIEISSMGGNLISAENTLIAVNSSNIAVAYDRKDLFDLLINLERTFPNDLEIKYRIGMLLLENNKTDDAIVYFKKILAEYEKNKKSTFNQIVIQSNRTLFSIYYERAQELYLEGKLRELTAYISIAKQYSQTKDEYIRIMLIDIKSTQKLAASPNAKLKRDDVFRLLDDLMSKYPDYVHDFPSGEMSVKIYTALEGALFAEQINNPLKAVNYWQKIILYKPDINYLGKSLYDYSIERIDKLISENTRKIFETWDAKAEILLKSGVSTASSETLETLIDSYPNSLVCEKAYYELSMLYIRQEQLHDAMIIIQEFMVKFKISDKRAELMLRLYYIYTNNEILFSARNLLLDIAKEFKGQKIKYGTMEIEIDEFVKEQLALEKFKGLKIHKIIPRLAEPPLKQRFQKSFSNKTFPKLLLIEGTIPEKYSENTYVIHSLGLLQCLNTLNGIERWTANVQNTAVKSFYINNTLIIITTSGIYNINPANGNSNWTRMFNYSIDQAAIGDGIIALIGGKISENSGERIYTVFFCNIDDGRIITQYRFNRIDSVKDIQFFDKTLLLYVDKPSSSYPESIIAFDTENTDVPKYEITLTQRLKHYYIVLAGDNNITLLLRNNQLRIYDLKTGNIKKVKTLDHATWSSQQANDKIYVSGVINSGYIGLDPETFEQKWVILLKNVYSYPDYVLDNDRLYTFYRTRDNKYIIEAYNSSTGKQLWQKQLLELKREMSENIELLITQKYIVAVHEKMMTNTNQSSYSRQWNAKMCIVDKASGEILQYLQYDPLEQDTRMPKVLVIKDNLYVESNSLTCFGK